jgi:uncharacterized protein (DUF1330 family)
MEIISQLDGEYIIRRYANAARVGQSRKCQQLRIEFPKIESNHAVFQSDQSLGALVRRSRRSGVKGLVNEDNACEP